MPVLTKKAGSIFDWHSWGKSIDNMTYDFLLWIPVNASIGIYSLTTGIVETESNAFRHIWSLFKIYVIFNPWAPCKAARSLCPIKPTHSGLIITDDHVYMSLAGAADEYVLNEHGVIYIGNEKTPGKKVWNYNLFDFETVNITFWLLQKTQLTVDQLANPIYVSRMLSKIVRVCASIISFSKENNHCFDNMFHLILKNKGQL